MDGRTDGQTLFHGTLPAKARGPITQKTAANSCILNTKVVASLKYLGNFWRYLDLPLINWEIELDLSWSKDCVISEILNNAAVPANPVANPPVQVLPEGSTIGATFQIK